ncbi:hypothetical protein FOCC_FOCC000062 [Frankliniella occidentalis]|nr:hypothetical protein FOCC_FOCC000062 [Frankliniella occidentalis]
MILSYFQSDGQQVVYEGNKVVVEGDPFTITCHLTVYDVIKWQLNEQTINPDSENQYKLEEEKINGKVVAKLSVLQAQHSHTGSYRCTSFSNVTHQVYVLSANSVKPNWDFEPYKVFKYDTAFALQCNVTGTPGGQFVLRWYKEDKVIEPTANKYIFKPEENTLMVYYASDDDVGNYTCQAVNAKTNSTESVMRAVIQVIGFPKITLPGDTPVVEGERLKLHCQVKGYPTPSVVWSVDGMPVNESDARIRFENDGKVARAFLIIDNVQLSDRKTYTCKASNIANQDSTGVEEKTFVRVKDKLAALWPFLGICAEVAVLCTIILIYEKKRNKSELDESDTDQSPEQKNTPDHGKDVRQRK